MAGSTTDEVDIVRAVERQIGGIQLGHIRMLGIYSRVTSGAGLLGVQAHRGALLEVAGGAFKTLVNRPFQITAVIGAWLVAFFA